MTPQGSDLSLENFNGQTPLHAAARRGQAGAVTMLLQRGVPVDTRDEDGLSPLLLAVKGRYLGVQAGAPCGGPGWSRLGEGCQVTQRTCASESPTHHTGRASWRRRPLSLARQVQQDPGTEF